MKKINYILLLLLICSCAIGQVNKLPANFEDLAKKEFAKVQKGWEGSYSDFKNIYQQVYLANQNKSNKSKITADISDCGDGGFESGVLNPLDWNGFYHNFYGGFNCSDNSSMNNMNSPTYPWIPQFTNTPPTSCEYPGWTVQNNNSTACAIPPSCVSSLQPEASLSHFFITSTGNDPIMGALVTQVRTGNHALRLGNAYPNNGSEKITKTFTVNSTNQIFSFWYALVMGYPDDGSHIINPPPVEMPGFIVQVIDNTFGNTQNNLVNLSGGLNYIQAHDPFLFNTTGYSNPCNTAYPNNRQPIAYRPWTFCSFSLNSLIGHNVTIEIITRDCSHAGHFAYAYLDDFCSKSDTTNPIGYIGIDPGSTDTCGFPGNICVKYTVPNNQVTTGTTQITLNFLQNGVSVGTPLTSGTLSANGTYCFNLTAANSPSTDFDYVITGAFTFPLTILPSQYIGTPPDGVTAGQNNDYKIICPPLTSICNNCAKVLNSLSLTAGSITTGTGYNLQNAQLNFSNISNLQEVQISIADIAYSWDKEGCKNCKTEAIGRGCLFPQSSTQTIGGLIWNNVHNSGVPPAANINECPGELIWGLGNVLTPGSYTVPLNISLPLPTVPGCCSLHLDKLCLKVSFKDVNCNTCDTIICINTDQAKDCCKGGYWQSEQILPAGTPVSSNQNVINIDCSKPQIPYTLQCNKAYTFQAAYVCADKTCTKKITYQLSGPTSQSGTLPATFTPTQSGTYQIAYYAWCGDKICDICKFSVHVDCDGSSGSECKCNFNPILTGGVKPPWTQQIQCGGTFNWFIDNIPVNLNPGFSCVDNNGLECSTPGSLTVTLKNLATNVVTTLTPPNYSYTYLVPGTYLYTLTGACGASTCTCSFTVIISSGSKSNGSKKNAGIRNPKLTKANAGRGKFTNPNYANEKYMKAGLKDLNRKLTANDKVDFLEDDKIVINGTANPAPQKTIMVYTIEKNTNSDLFSVSVSLCGESPDFAALSA